MNDFWKIPRPFYHTDTYFEDEEARELYRVADRCDFRSCLDIGCGNPDRGRRILRGAKFLDSVDKNAHYEGVIEGSILSYSGGPYSLVLCCRVLNNVPESLRKTAIKNLANLVTENGHLILSDGTALQREATNLWRERQGWERLPPSSSGSTELSPETVAELANYFRCEKVVLPAADYMIWTRRDQEELLAADDPRRYAFPRYSPTVRSQYSWPRIWLLRRVARNT